MPAPISNQLSTNPGLISTNPFLSSPNISTGGETTPEVGGTSGGQQFAGIPYSTGTPSTPVTSNISFGSIPIGNNNGILHSSNQTTSSGLVSSSTPVNNASSNTYNGGVNGSGQTFPGYVSALSGTAAGPTESYNQNQGNSVADQQGLVNTVPQNNANVQAATQNIQDLQNSYANQTGLIGNSPIGISEQGGEQGLLNTQYSSKLAAAQGALTNTLTGNAQNQTAYNEAGGLANTAAGNATKQQETQQSGQYEAGTLTQPQTANPYGVYNPANGTYDSYGGANGSGAAGAGGVQTQVQQGASVQQMTGQQAQAQALAQNLNSVISGAGINPASPGNAGPMTAYVNGALQWINNQSGDPQYQNFANLVSEIASRYASILNQSGGTPTDQSTLSHTILNSLAGGQSIEQVLQSLDKNATDSINALKRASQTNANGTTANTSSQYNF